MQTTLLEAPVMDIDEILYQRAALRECIAYGEHGIDVETDDQGRDVCFNCGGAL